MHSNPALKPIATSPVYIEAAQLLDAGLKYKSMEIYEAYIKQLQKARYPTRNKVTLDSSQKIDLYFERFTSLLKSIQTHDPKPLKEVRHIASSMNSISAIRTWRTNFGETNLDVALDAAGELVALPGGQYRLAIALTLKLSRIPVELRLIRQAKRTGFPINQTIDSVTGLFETIERTRTPKQYTAA